jgi:hypothetical protein
MTDTSAAIAPRNQHETLHFKIKRQRVNIKKCQVFRNLVLLDGFMELGTKAGLVELAT